MEATSLDQSDLDRLNENDKAELRQFITRENQRTRIQSQTHVLTEICWRKCVTSTKGGKLDGGEETCLANCVDRFLDVNMLTMKHLSTMRQG